MNSVEYHSSNFASFPASFTLYANHAIPKPVRGLVSTSVRNNSPAVVVVTAGSKVYTVNPFYLQSFSHPSVDRVSVVVNAPTSGIGFTGDVDVISADTALEPQQNVIAQPSGIPWSIALFAPLNVAAFTESLSNIYFQAGALPSNAPGSPTKFSSQILVTDLIVGLGSSTMQGLAISLNNRRTLNTGFPIDVPVIGGAFVSHAFAQPFSLWNFDPNVDKIGDQFALQFLLTTGTGGSAQELALTLAGYVT